MLDIINIIYYNNSYYIQLDSWCIMSAPWKWDTPMEKGSWNYMYDRENRRIRIAVLAFVVLVLVIAVAIFTPSNDKTTCFGDVELINDLDTIYWCECRNDTDYFMVKAWLKDFIVKNSGDVAQHVVFLRNENRYFIKVFFQKEDENWYKFYITKGNTRRDSWKSVNALIDEAMWL